MDANASFAFFCAAAMVLALALGHATERPRELSLKSGSIAPINYAAVE
ncbi:MULTISPECIES: hypothetical protein [Mesorhizobium]|nr:MULTISPECIES: hypothetical protein [Mesorhizobium]